jgi:hypothetical protein
MTRLRAFQFHLAVSFALAAIVCAVVFLVWYPNPYFRINGTMSVLAVLLGVDVILGPALTLYLFKPGKPGLMFDMVFIAVSQAIALGYGSYVIFQERPYFAVFAIDRFEIVALTEVDVSSAPNPKIFDKPFIGPKLVFAPLPKSEERLQTLIDEVVFGGQADIERRPEFWEAYEDNVSNVVAALKDLSNLAARDERSSRSVDKLLASLGRPADELGYVPVIGRNKSFAFVLDRATGQPIDIVDVDPWPVIEAPPESPSGAH